MTLWEMTVRLAIAGICGGLIGFEREQQQKPAGLRTHMLVALGAAAFTLASLVAGESAYEAGASSHLQLDPTRAIQGIVGGIGFLGAGSVLRIGANVQGLTTAATIWVVGAVGIACGLGNYGLALVTSVIALVITGVLGILTRYLFAHQPAHSATEQPVTGDRESAGNSD